MPTYYRDPDVKIYKSSGDSSSAVWFVAFIVVGVLAFLGFTRGYFTQSGTVTGKVQVESAAQGAQCYVQMIAEKATGGFDKFGCYADGAGKFAFRKVQTGKYDIYVYASGLEHFPTLNQTVDVKLGKNVKLDFKVSQATVSQMLAMEDKYKKAMTRQSARG